METVNQSPKKVRSMKGLTAAGVLVVLLIIVGASSVAQVEYGHVGLYKTFGKLHSSVLAPGLHLKIPFVQNVIQVNTQVTKSETDATASSKDLQPVSTHVAVNFSVNKESSLSLHFRSWSWRCLLLL